MPISNLSVLLDGTIAVTAGTSTNVKSLGGDIDVNECYLDDGVSYLDTTRIKFAVKRPKPNASAPNGFTQKRNTVKVTVPRTLANGNTTLDTLSIVIGTDVETSDTDVLSLVNLGAQLMSNADVLAYFTEQSTV